MSEPKPKKLTQKQEAFAVEYVNNGGNASAAYRHAYDAGSMAEQSVWVKASELLSNGKVAVRVATLQDARKEVLQWSDMERLKRLKKAADDDDHRAAISAISEANKMLGSHAPEKREHSGNVGSGPVTLNISVVPPVDHDDL